LACDITGSSDSRSLGLNVALLIVRSNRTLQCDLTVLGDDLDVVSVGRKRLVFHDRRPDLLGYIPISGLVSLLIGCGGVFIRIALIGFGVVGLLESLRRPGRGQAESNSQKGDYANLLHLLDILHSYPRVTGRPLGCWLLIWMPLLFPSLLR
jgi:hypothetical protein